MKFYIQCRKFLSKDVYRLQDDGTGRKLQAQLDVLPGDRLFDTAGEALALRKEGNTIVLDGEVCELPNGFLNVDEAKNAPVVSLHVHREDADHVQEFGAEDITTAIRSSAPKTTGVLIVDLLGNVFWRAWDEEPFVKTDMNIAVRYGSRFFETGDESDDELVERITENLKKGWSRHLESGRVNIFVEDE